jgi:aspartate aminotransferase-like enzyme
MEEPPLLLNPGPVPISPAVREAMTEPMISHRSPAFESVYQRAQDALTEIFERSTLSGHRTATDGTSLILNGTATMAMEAAVANLVDEDSEVVALVNGKFGRRFARIGERHANVRRVEVPWGESLDMDRVQDAVQSETDVVTVVHNETSTGLLNPVSAIGEIAADAEARLVVDGVTSIGGDEFKIDDWNVDIAITDAQKCLAAPPGVSALYLVDGIESELSGAAAPFYEDLDWHCRKAQTAQTPFTSAIPLFRALAVASELVLDEGLPARIGRHRRQAGALRAAFRALGLTRFAEPTGPTELSHTVTAIECPTEVRENWDAFQEAVLARGVSIAGGQAHLAGDIFRISNMGSLTAGDLRRGVEAVAGGLSEVGVTADVDVGVAALEDTLAESDDGPP